MTYSKEIYSITNKTIVFLAKNLTAKFAEQMQRAQR